METGTLKVNDVEIAYNIINPATVNAIFFIHGNSGSSTAWRKQVQSPLLNTYRLITIDLPNHGNSSALDAGGEFLS
jgi:pimeloyl-ACP methyl ester carboxylesterase